MNVSPTLDKRFREAAAAAGLLDVAYDLAETPIGTLLVATTERGLCRISFDPQPDREAEWLAQAFGVKVLRAAKPIAPRARAHWVPPAAPGHWPTPRLGGSCPGGHGWWWFCPRRWGR